MLYSATLDYRVKNIAGDYMNNAEEIEIEPEQVTVENISQKLYHVGREEKINLLLGILKKEEPRNAIKRMMEVTGAEVHNIRKTNLGFEVTWSFEGNRINTLVSRQFEVVEAGFCMSGHDRTQSARSMVNVMKDYLRDGDYIHRTRTVD